MICMNNLIECGYEFRQLFYEILESRKYSQIFSVHSLDLYSVKMSLVEWLLRHFNDEYKKFN